MYIIITNIQRQRYKDNDNDIDYDNDNNNDNDTNEHTESIVLNCVRADKYIYMNVYIYKATEKNTGLFLTESMLLTRLDGGSGLV